ncbi:MAG: DUF1289 domain-containing protein [Candidatus Dadabacteria bacterium]|nr:DUF1289 domain-containing protein [Candidatus Dadabacteria bacterium]
MNLKKCLRKCKISITKDYCISCNRTLKEIRMTHELEVILENIKKNLRTQQDRLNSIIEKVELSRQQTETIESKVIDLLNELNNKEEIN